MSPTNNLSPSASSNSDHPGAVTYAEILQQPVLWPTTLERVKNSDLSGMPQDGTVIITGAGSSAYAASAIAASWRGSRAIPTTDLLLDSRQFFNDQGLLVSLARSGQSPESLAVLDKVQRLFPDVKHLAITCNAEGGLARAAGIQKIILDPRTNDKGLAMTSSFSNLVLAGLAVRHARELTLTLSTICGRVESNLAEFQEKARSIAYRQVSRVVVLSSRPLYGAAREASLKILEMTAGKIVAIPETFLGLRHGPMSFLRPDSLVLCFLSSDPAIRRYEKDLIDELSRKQLGFIVAIAPESSAHDAFNEIVPASAPNLPDHLRTPFEIVFPQLLAYFLSLQSGLDPDNPSPAGVITRVVQGFRIHES